MAAYSSVVRRYGLVFERRGHDTGNMDSMTLDPTRFITAQDNGGVYATAVAELRMGRKRSRWMWFVFPPLAGQGQSPTSKY